MAKEKKAAAPKEEKPKASKAESDRFAAKQAKDSRIR